jgi:tetratricopeptide (TPR) repeat protein
MDPDRAVDISVPVRLAEACAAASRSPRTLYTRGLACYRAGRYQEAIDWLDAALESAPDDTDAPLAWPLLALAHQRLGNAAEAWHWLHQAHLLRLGPPAGLRPTSFSPETNAWRWVEFLILSREADALILDDGFPADPFEPA